MSLVSFSASEYAYPFYTLMLILIAPAWWLGAVFTTCIGFLIEVTAQKILKYSLKRRRPCDAVPGITALVSIPDRYSFPSGHAGGSFNVTITMILFIGPAATLLFIWAVIASISRVYNGVHYPGDVIAGAFIGSAATLTGYAITSSILALP